MLASSQLHGCSCLQSGMRVYFSVMLQWTINIIERENKKAPAADKMKKKKEKAKTNNKKYFLNFRVNFINIKYLLSFKNDIHYNFITSQLFKHKMYLILKMKNTRYIGQRSTNLATI